MAESGKSLLVKQFQVRKMFSAEKAQDRRATASQAFPGRCGLFKRHSQSPGYGMRLVDPATYIYPASSGVLFSDQGNLSISPRVHRTGEQALNGRPPEFSPGHIHGRRIVELCGIASIRFGIQEIQVPKAAEPQHNHRCKQIDSNGDK